jgi:hypothetical protein
MYKLITSANLHFSEHRSRITNLFPNGDKLFRRTFLLEAKTHQERATFNNASRTTESPNVDEFEHEVLREIELRELIDKFAKVSKNSDLQLTFCTIARV